MLLKPARSTSFDTAIAVWFQCSVLMIIACIAWLAAVIHVPLYSAAICTLTAVFIAWCSDWLRRKVGIFVVRYSVFAIVYVLTLLQPFPVVSSAQHWLSASIQDVRNTVLPLEMITEEERIVSTSSQIAAATHLPSWEDFNPIVDTKILISFVRYGLAMLEEDSLRFLTNRKVYLLTANADNTITYMRGIGSGQNANTRNGRTQVLTRARVTASGLEKIWERKVQGEHLHHWGSSFGDRVYLPGRAFRDLPNSTSKKIGGKFSLCDTEDIRSDTISIFHASTGEHETSIELLDQIALLPSEHPLLSKVRACKDPLHLNSVRIVDTQQKAAYFPNGKIGDMLVSLRSMNALMLLDRDTYAVKWHLTNDKEHMYFMRQHSPRITDRGTVLVYDNHGATTHKPRSRVVEIDIQTKQIVGNYSGSDEEAFHSTNMGKVQKLGDRIFVYSQSDRENGVSMFELDCPETYISQACKKISIFSGPGSTHGYDNAFVLPQRESER